MEILKNLSQNLERNSGKPITNLLLKREDSAIYGNVDGLSLQNLFYTYNGYFPNCYMFVNNLRNNDQHFDTQQLYDYLVERKDEKDISIMQYVTENIDTNEIRMVFCVIMNKDNIFARFEKSVSESYILYGNNDTEGLHWLRDAALKFYINPEPEKNNLYMIGRSMDGFTLIKSKVKEIKDFNIEKNYNDDFMREDEKIQKFIKTQDKSGLVILHGEKGTGKTTYIRHLINTNQERKFVTVPANMIQQLGMPEFGTFIMGLANHIIILEDCENAIRDRKVTGTSSAVSLLLNMSDGLLSDDLGIKFICTFNEDVRNIDPALMRKGRLVSKYEFKPLSVEKTNALIEEVMGKEDAINVTEPMTLADIYNINEDSYETSKSSFII